MSAPIPTVDHLFYFGRFNLAHHGYLSVIRIALEMIAPRFGITIVPSPDTPTWGQYTLPFEHRVSMLKEAFGSELSKLDQEKIQISDIELKLLHQGISGNFTINTLRFLKTELPTSETIGLVMGADAAASFTRWKDWEEILQLARLYIVPRAELQTELQIENSLSPKLSSYLDTQRVCILPADTRFLSDLATHASSTAVLAGRLDYLPESVQHYTQQQHLI